MYFLTNLITIPQYGYRFYCFITNNPNPCIVLRGSWLTRTKIGQMTPSVGWAPLLTVAHCRSLLVKVAWQHPWLWFLFHWHPYDLPQLRRRTIYIGKWGSLVPTTRFANEGPLWSTIHSAAMQVIHIVRWLEAYMCSMVFLRHFQNLIQSLWLSLELASSSALCSAAWPESYWNRKRNHWQIGQKLTWQMISWEKKPAKSLIHTDSEDQLYQWKWRWNKLLNHWWANTLFSDSVHSIHQLAQRKVAKEFVFVLRVMVRLHLPGMMPPA